MATIFTHTLVPLAARSVVGPQVFSRRLMVWAALATILPDADVIAFGLGIPYSDPFGHRGFTHSIAFAGTMGLMAYAFAPQLNSSRAAACSLIFLSVLSHPFLDSFTNGGLGVAWFWPLDNTRYFMPWQPLEVSPIGASGFFSSRGATVLVSEIKWVVAPMAAVMIAGRLTQAARKKWLK